MNKQTQKELLQILNNKGGNLYDFICNNYYLMSASELADLSKEIVALLYVYAERLNPNNNKERDEKLHAELLENIKEWREELITDDEESEQ